MKKIIPYLISLCLFFFLSSSQCSDGPDANEIKVNETSVNIPSEGGEFIFTCQNYSYWMVEKYLIINGDKENIEYPTDQTCDDVCTYENEWLTVTIPKEHKNQLIVKMQPYTTATSRNRGVEVEMKTNDAHITLSASQYSSNAPEL